MTLSSRIDALTGASREIDAEIASFLGWDHSGYPRADFEVSGRWQRELPSTYPDYVDCPNYTANIMHVFDECDKRGWGTWQSSPAGEWHCSFSINIKGRGNEFSGIRTDRNIAIAACEALVRAVENNPNGA